MNSHKCLIIMLVFSCVYSAELSTTTSLKSRIHGGEDAPSGYAPHMAALISVSFTVLVVCGGSIVTTKHILTAAHCIIPHVQDDNQLAPTFYGRVGSNLWNSGGLIVNFKSYSVHPKWDEHLIKYDVGILVLTHRLHLTNKIAVIGLDFGWVEGNLKSYVTGWGITWPLFQDNWVNLAPTPDNLQLLYKNTLSHEECVEQMGSNPKWSSIAPPLNSTIEICAFHSEGYGTCHGDSGSALVSEDTGLLIGVVSWGMPCALGAPDVYARPFGVKDYILSILNKDSLLL